MHNLSIRYQVFLICTFKFKLLSLWQMICCSLSERWKMEFQRKSPDTQMQVNFLNFFLLKISTSSPPSTPSPLPPLLSPYPHSSSPPPFHSSSLSSLNILKIGFHYAVYAVPKLVLLLHFSTNCFRLQIYGHMSVTHI